MGSAGNKPKVEWVEPDGHAFVRKDKEVSIRSVCGMDRDENERLVKTSKRCDACKTMLRHKVQSGFVPRRIRNGTASN